MTGTPTIGLEIHQQLDTKTKLFCHCPTTMHNEAPRFAFSRYLFPVTGEMGRQDPAAHYEFQKRQRYVYQVYSNNCLVEMDEEPPQPLNTNALFYAVQAALLMGSSVPDEIQIMRKTVVDGSNTTGFQRTCLVGLHGSIEANGSTVPIETINIEEDACGLHERKSDKAVYDLNRLGIPLLEVGTAPVLKSGAECKAAALEIGQLLRALPVKRGLGTIRQDVNISLPTGARVEIKGFQDVKRIDELVDNEIERQEQLIAIRDQLQQHNITELSIEEYDVSHIFLYCDHELLRTIAESGVIKAYVVPGLCGYMKKQLCGDKTLATELTEYLRPFGIHGFIHSDEDLAAYGVVKEWQQVKRTVTAGNNDLIMLIALDAGSEESDLQSFFERVASLPQRVPEETRRAERDATTSYLRPLPGSARLYPETDVAPVQITGSLKQRAYETLPETPQERYQRLKTEIGGELAQQLMDSPHYDTYARLKERHDPHLVANVLTNVLGKVAQEGVLVEHIAVETLDALLTMYENNSIAKSAFSYILQHFPSSASVETVVKREGLYKASAEEIRTVVQEQLRQIGEVDNVKAVVGQTTGGVMQTLAGRVDGDEVKDLVQSILEE